DARSPPALPPETGEPAESRLRRSGYLALQHLSCEFRAGVLTLRGRLPTCYLNQVALAVVGTVEGIQRIDDQLEVAAHTTGFLLSRCPRRNGGNPQEERGIWKGNTDE